MNWLPIPGFAPYEVSDTGQVRRDGRVLTPREHRGYLRVQAWVDKRPRSLRIHRAVCLAFNGPQPSPEHEVEHIDHDKANNAPSNLRWVSHAENIARSIRDGVHPQGGRIGSAKLTREAVEEIRATPRYYGCARDLAAKHGVSVKTINGIRCGYTWGGPK